MYCKNCGHSNDSDAKYCEKCGIELKPLAKNRDSSPKKEGMNKTTTILIVAIVVLVGVVGLASVFLFQMNKETLTPVNSSSNSTSQNVNAQATWHKIATYSNGYSNHGSVYDVNTRADNVRITFSGVPVKNNIGMPSQLKVTTLKYIEGEGAVTFAGEGELNWGDENTAKENTFEFTTTSRKIQIQVSPLQLESWEVNVWNYY
jgi:cytoskeletal protein RodZ